MRPGLASSVLLRIAVVQLWRFARFRSCRGARVRQAADRAADAPQCQAWVPAFPRKRATQLRENVSAASAHVCPELVSAGC